MNPSASTPHAAERSEPAYRFVSIFGFTYISGPKLALAHLVMIALLDRFLWLFFGREARAPAPDLRGKVMAVAKIDLLGDVLMITPVLRELRRQAPSTRLLLIVGSWSKGAAQLLLEEKLCDQVIVYDPPTMSPVHRTVFEKAKQFLLTLRTARAELRRQKPDVFFDLRSTSPNSLLLARLSGVRHKVGYGLRGFSWLLQQEIPFDGRKVMGQQYLDALETLGLRSTHYEKPILTWQGVAEPAPEGLFSELPALLLHPFSRNPRKMISARWWGDALRLLAADRKVVVLGTREDLENRELIDVLSAAGCDLSAVGRTSFRQAVACVREAATFVGVDSVFAHVALAHDKPALIVAIRGASFRPAFPEANPHLFFLEVDAAATTPDLISPVVQEYAAQIGRASEPSFAGRVA